ncbi:MAG: cell division protein FtsX [Candidatus Rokuibacteriota bacterium]
MIWFLIAETVRDLRRAGRLAVSAVVLITLSVVAAGAFWIMSTNLGGAIGQWRERVRVIVYLKGEASVPEALLERVRDIPGVMAARYVSKAEALETLRDALGKEAAVADRLSANPLPASLEVTPAADASTPDGARTLLAALAALPETEEVAGGTDWVERLARWQRLLQVVGLGLGGVLAVAAVLTVTTATTLVLHARRHETEIMRLVGAPEFTIRLPLILQGSAQGLLGATLAVAILAVAHYTLAPRLEVLLSITLGLSEVRFLTPATLLSLVLAGALLGGAGGALARGPRNPSR